MRTEPLRSVGGRWLVLAVIVVLAALPSHAQTLNRNLVINGGAEDGPAAETLHDAQVTQIPGWTVTGPLSVGTYGTPDFPRPNYGPVNPGSQVFFGGPREDHSSATQIISLQGAATEIDAGRVKFYLSGYLGSLADMPVSVGSIFIKGEFMDAAGATVLQAVAPGPKYEEAQGGAGLLLRQVTGFLPPNVRRVRLTVDLGTADAGSVNLLAADNISLVLTTESMLGVNLLVNGDAEGDPKLVDGGPVAGWNSHRYFTIWKWGDTGNPLVTDPGPADRGDYFFICWGLRANDNRAYQFVDISAAKNSIDRGQLSFALSGWFGAGLSDYPNLPDTAILDVTFYDAAGNIILARQTDPVTVQDRNGQIGMWKRSVNGSVPAGARLARVTVTFNRLHDSTVIPNTQAYADSLSFVLTSDAAPNIGGIISLGDFGALPNFAAGSLIEIYGSNLASKTRQWSSADFNGSNAPTALDGTTVTVNGKNAFVAFISPSQVNVQVPDGVGTGPVPVIVKTAAGTSNAFTVTAQPTTAGLLAPAAFKVNTKQYVAAFVGPDYKSRFALPTGAIQNVLSHPAKPGDTVVIYAVGLGPVTPATPAGTLVTTPTTLANQLQIFFGSTPGQVTYSGLSSDIGIYQLNVVVPAIPDNDAVPLTFNLGGAPGAQTLYIAVHQ